MSKSLPTADVIYPGLSRYKAWSDAISLHNQRLDSDHIPHCAVRAQSEEDVILVVKFCSENNLLLSIKSTGHCYSGNCVQQDSFLLDMSLMNDLSLNADGESITLQPGSNFDALYALNEESGTQSVGGMCGTVGPVGFSLGGGHGPLIRSYGLGTDQILSVDLVTAAGKLISVSKSSHPDLFWALQGGGGGSFGVVTSITLRTHPAPSSLTSYVCNYPLSLSIDYEVGDSGVATVGSWWSDVMPNLPNEWTFFSVLLPAPIPLEQNIPEYDKNTMQGLLSLEGLFNGDYSSAVESLGLQGLLDLDVDRQMSCKFENHTSLKTWHDSRWFGKTPVPTRNYMSTSFAQKNFDGKNLAKVAVNAILNTDNTMSSFFGIQTGGAVNSASDTDTAISSAFRNSDMLMEIDANWILKSNDDAQTAWTHGVGLDVAALDDIAGAYVNEPDPNLDDWEDMFWGANFQRLQEIKSAVDPTAFFECWQCVHA
ncbi:hypothetical protein TL16_g10301 [Triparma laevis f. inornata]|uniref:FAD-binding PCMH-type domain-containing protein n=1 Tax=Triparma laevis f. inornata TaxID=1714386 RepID=A0A9W7B883_9STRA|nr:hypothetical protein TL16_g10301 [Triparma laevis f. inornata]